MPEPLASKYNPHDVEDRLYRFWEEGRFFHSEPDPSRKPYTIVIPPPNVTGALHMGHALNNALQDVLIRWRRMQGYNALWMPGTDHAGIATQNVVEKELAVEGKNREQLGREKFLERVWQWKEQYGSTITQQLRKLGSSCDWARERFTMDEGLSAAVREAFVRLYERGLIYKGKYIINWCPRCRTALADDEVEHEEHEGHLWHIHYPFKDAKLGHVTVATTRPETMLGDVAVAVDPKDSRYAHLVGKTLILPFLGREMPLIADAYVDAHFGTGCLKVTPAHDPNDFQMGQRHGLTPVCVMNEDATMNRNAGGEFIGMDRFECREALVEELRQKKLLAKIEPYRHAVGHCYRCHTVIEPYLSDQWFVKMKPLAEKAMRATQKGHVAFYPERWSRIYLSWLEQVRDWCISRQIWWGHRIPAWYCQRCKHVAVARETPTACAKCKSANLKQDDDVLDTWFSSALWPFSTMGWPQDTPELAYYYPTSTLVTDRGIIYFWVARMVMMGLEMMGDVPYAHVYINSTVLDKDGRKMSKSHPETCLDPLELIETYGADAVRFTLMLLTAEGQDVRLIAERDESGRNVSQKFEMGRNFANKLWNAARFALMNLCSAPVMASADLPAASTAFEDRWILSRLNSVTERCTAALEKYQFNEAADTLYHFVWHEFCDWYLECIKPRLRETAEASDRAMAQAVLTRVLDSILRLLHPFTPYVTAEIWQHL
ncbi:MAG: valine--tRNA ligase, partial [Planctomycetes bacterium]|nr:valine--tRNA ligase [Planctomycetota bacterium]